MKKAGKLFLGMTAAAAMLAYGAGSANASLYIVSVNFDRGPDIDGSAPIASSEVLGVLPAANWNNVTISAGSASGLLDSDGNATTVGITYAGAFDSWNTPNTGDQAVYRDAIRMGANALTITGITQPYNLIVYVNEFPSYPHPVSLTFNGNTINGSILASGQSGYVENSTYFKWDNMSGTGTLTITDNRQFGGFQIEVIPEPTTGMLAALAGGLLMLRRRRSA